jgi:hypothetical protein
VGEMDGFLSFIGWSIFWYVMTLLQFVPSWWLYHMSGGYQGFFGCLVVVFGFLINLFFASMHFGGSIILLVILFIASLPLVLKVFRYFFPEKEEPTWEEKFNDEEYRRKHHLLPRSMYKKYNNNK